MTEKTLEMQAVELVAMARGEGAIRNLSGCKNRIRSTIDVIGISFKQVKEIEDMDDCVNITGIQLKAICKTLKKNIINELEKARLI